MLRRRQTPKEEPRELGFGTKLVDTTTRLVNQNGTFNVERTGKPLGRDLYHRFITMPWSLFFLLLVAGYFAINCLFALLYMAAGLEDLQGAQQQDLLQGFWEAFFFSTQTFTTVGYGRIAPVGWTASMIASVESMLGLLAFAMATGVLYGRFARPVARIVYSGQALMAPYKDRTAFMFRLANARNSQLIEVTVEVVLSMIDHGNGQAEPRRRYYNLKLELDRINLLSLSWTIVHALDEDSPLHGMTHADLETSDAEFLIMIKAFDDTFSQVVYHRSSYRYDEIVWGAKFKPMYTPNRENGKVRLELDRISEFEAVGLPEPVLETEGENETETTGA